MVASPPHQCHWCNQRRDDLKACAKCKLVHYCGRECQIAAWSAGHKVLCAAVPKAVLRAGERFRLGDYTTERMGTNIFATTEAISRRGEIVEERQAQDACYDAMEMEEGSPEKLRRVLHALRLFPLSTEAWGMLGHFYHYELLKDDSEDSACSERALKMYDKAIECARKLNPMWTEDGGREVRWGLIENRPYLRSLAAKPLVLRNIGRKDDAIEHARKFLRVNPSDGMGMKQVLCNWFLEAGNTEGCLILLRRYGTKDTAMAYADVILQYLLWKRGDAGESDVKKALYFALKENPFVPDMLGQDIEKERISSYSPGSMKDASRYVVASRELWGAYPEALQWVKSKRIEGSMVPDEMDLIELLKSGVKFQMKCNHTDLRGHNPLCSYLFGTQKKSQCFGCGTSDFVWPRQMKMTYEPECNSDIFVYHNDQNDIHKSKLRKMKYSDILEVPYWRILVQFYEDDDVTNEESEVKKSDWSIPPEEKRRNGYTSANLEQPICTQCSSPARFCALDHDCTEFYCSKSCMESLLEETDPIYFDLEAQTLKIHASEACSIRTVNLDDAFKVAAHCMKTLNSVDIFINQQYVLSEDFGNDEEKKMLLLSSSVLRQFLECVSGKLVSFSFRLDDCCWDELKTMTDDCRALVPLGTMPNLRKLNLSRFGFNDIDVLTACLGAGLKSLDLNDVMMSQHEWTAAEVNSLVTKIAQRRGLVTLNLSDIAVTDWNLQNLLPNLHELRCINLSGRFGYNPYHDNSRHSLLTDAGLTVLSRCCPKIQSVDISYQRKCTIAGLQALVQNCPNLVDIEASELSFGMHDLGEMLTTPHKLLFVRVDTHNTDISILQNAMKRAKGKLVLGSSSRGLYPVKLSHDFQRNRDDTIRKLEETFKRYTNPRIYNVWEGLA